MAKETGQPEIRLKFLQGAIAEVKGSAFVYTLERSGLVAARYISGSPADFKKKNLRISYDIFNKELKFKLFAADVKVRKPKDLLGGLEDVVQVKCLSRGVRTNMVVATGLIAYLNLYHNCLQRTPVKAELSPGKSRVRRYYEINVPDFFDFVIDVYMEPLSDAAHTGNAVALGEGLEKLTRFAYGSPFESTVKQLKAQILALKKLPDPEFFGDFAKLMQAKYGVHVAVTSPEEKYEEAAKFRDQAKELEQKLKIADSVSR